MSENPFQRDHSGIRTLVVFTIVFGGVCGLVFLSTLVGKVNPIRKDEVNELQSKVEKMVEKDERERQQAEKQRRLNEFQPWAKLVAQLKRADVVISRSQQQNKVSKTKFTFLLNSDQGKGVAANRDLIDSFRKLKQDFVAIEQMAKELYEDFAELDDQVQAATERERAYEPPSTRLMQSVSTIGGRAEELAGKSLQILEGLRTLEDSSVQNSDGDFLVNAISELEQAEKDEYLRIEREALRRIQAEETERRIRERLKLEAEKYAAERKREQIRHDAEMARIAAENQRSEKDAERNRQLELEAARIRDEDNALQIALPEIRQVLAPFIAKSNVQITAEKQKVVTEDPQPASWQAIQASRALDPSSRYYWRSFVLALDSAGRSKGSTPIDEYDYEGVGKAQLLLKKHGPAMVRAGLLVE